MSNEILTTALRFASAGIVAVPVAGDGSKRPGLNTWKEYQYKQPTPEELLGWFNQDSRGIGVICGAISGNLEMLELEGRAVSAKMHTEIGQIAESSGLGDLWERLNAGYVEMTPSGGLHWLYRLTGPVPGNTKLARKPGENGTVDVFAETRGEGGFVITAPSSGSIHPSGGSWELLRGAIENIPTLSMAERDALHTIFAMFDEMPKADAITYDVSTKQDGVLSPGDDFNAKTTWEELLVPLGWKVAFRSQEKTTWTRPGKDFGVSATTNYQNTDKLRVFSTSTIFDAERSYDKFGAYAAIFHNGDFKEAAKDLRAKGYGQQGLNSFDLSKAPQTMAAMATLTGEEDGQVITTWEPIDLQGYFEGLFTLQEATLLKRTDGAGLLYPGKVHSFYGESESGKSWLAQIACAETIRSQNNVVYIDFESDPLDLANRLKILGISKAEAAMYFKYIRPENRNIKDDPAWLALLEQNSATLIIIDGVTEALTMWGKATKENDDITDWMRNFPRQLAKSGAAVVLVDHITKNAETRGRFAIGGQAKLATIDGAAYLIEPIRNLAPGGAGALTVRVTKDRPGAVRRKAGMWRKSDRTQEAAIIEVDSTEKVMKYVICVPMSEDEIVEDQELKMEKAIATFIATNPGCTKGEVTKGVKGGDHAIYERIEAMLSTGCLVDEGKGKAFAFYLTDIGGQKYQLKLATVTQIGGGNLA